MPLDRRTFLRGAGVSLALPLLEGMRPVLGSTVASAAAPATGKPPVRLAWVFFPNGTNYDEWAPEGLGKDWKASPTLEGLAGVRDDVLVLSGLAQNNARALGDGPGDHARSAAAFLTGAHPTKTHGAGIRAGVSIDQVAARAVGHQTRLPSLELGTESGRQAGSCDSGYSCAYSNNISWRSPNQPSAKEVNPRLAFERLFGGAGSNDDEAARRRAEQRSVLDIVADQARSLEKRLGKDDRQKLDEYFDSVREVERRIDRQDQLASEHTETDRYADLPRPPAEPADSVEHMRLMFDLLVLAFRTDTTRLSTFMLGNEGSNRTYPMIGVNEGHHALSHHQRNEAKMAQIAQIDRHLIEQYAYFVEKLRETPEGEGSLLDNCAVLYGCAISDGNRHTHHDLPIVLAGRGGGAFEPGRHVQAARDTPLCNLFLSMLDAAGVSPKRFGDSTGRFVAQS